jgi:hypothetical protein
MLVKGIIKDVLNLDDPVVSALLRAIAEVKQQYLDQKYLIY